jgi:hypothetical protein
LNPLIRPTTAGDWPALKSARLAALLDAPTAFGASHASAARFSDADWQQRSIPTPQRTFSSPLPARKPSAWPRKWWPATASAT